MGITESTWRERLAEGQVIPALPLALFEDGKWSPQHQRALMRYYIDAGAGGIAVGVHSTQFAIRSPEHGLFEPVLKLASDVANERGGPDFVRVAGICGDTKQAFDEASIAREHGYHAGLLSLTALNQADESQVLEHVQSVSKRLPVFGFYLQPAIGGRLFSYDFWRSFCDVENVIAIKMAPFNRYYTWDVIRAVIESGRDDIALYTGNDDNIVCDLVTPFRWQGQTRFISGGLLGQWGVWTRRAVEWLEAIKRERGNQAISVEWLSRNAAITDANAAIFDSAHHFAGCIPGILEILRRQGLVPSVRCLDPGERLSEGQASELDRVGAAYPELTDDAFVAEHRDAWLSD